MPTNQRTRDSDVVHSDNNKSDDIRFHRVPELIGDVDSYAHSDCSDVMHCDSAIECELYNGNDVIHNSALYAHDGEYSVNNNYNVSVLSDMAVSHVQDHAATSNHDICSSVHNNPPNCVDTVYCDMITCLTQALDCIDNVNCVHSDVNNNAQHDTLKPLTRIMDYKDPYGFTADVTTSEKARVINDNNQSKIQQCASQNRLTNTLENINDSDFPNDFCLYHSVNSDDYRIKGLTRIDKDFVEFPFISYNKHDIEFKKFNVLSQASSIDSVYNSDDLSTIVSSMESLNNIGCESTQGAPFDFYDTESIFDKILTKNSLCDSGIICTQDSSINSVENKDISTKGCYEKNENVCPKSFDNFEKDIENICLANDIFKKKYKYFSINDSDLGGKSALIPVLDKDRIKNSMNSYKDLFMRCPEQLQNNITITVFYMRSRHPTPNSTRDDASARNAAANHPNILYAGNASLSLQEDLFSGISHSSPPNNIILDDWFGEYNVQPIPTSTISASTYSSTNSFANPQRIETRGQFRSPLGSSRYSTNAALNSPREPIFTEALRSPRNPHAQPHVSPAELFNSSRNSFMRNPNSFRETPMNAFNPPVISPRDSYARRRPSPPTHIGGSNSGSQYNQFTTPHRWRSELNQPQPYEFENQNVSSFSSLSARNYAESSYSRNRGAVSLNSPPEQYQNPLGVTYRRGDRGSSSQLSPFSSECSSLRSEVAFSRENVAGTTFQLQTPRSDDGFASGGSQFNSPSTDRESDFDLAKPNQSWYDSSRSVERNDLFEINRRKKMKAAVDQYNREKERQRRKREAIASIVNRSPLYNWRDEFHLQSPRLQSDRNSQVARDESTNRHNPLWYDKETWNSEQLAFDSTLDRRQVQDYMSMSKKESWATSSRKNERSRNKSCDFPPPADLLPSDLFSESPPPFNQYGNDNIDTSQIEATATALSIVSLSEKIKMMTKQYLEVNQANASSLQQFTQPVRVQTSDQEHNDQLPLKMVGDVLNSDNYESNTTTESSRYHPLNESAVQFPLANNYSNIDQHFYKKEQRLDIPLQEELWSSQSSMTPLETSQFTRNISMPTQDIQSPYEYTSADLLQFELFCRQYDFYDGSSNDSGLQDLNLIQPTLCIAQELDTNLDLHTELSHDINVDERLSKLLPHWLTNDTRPKTESDEASAAQNFDKKDKTKQIPLFLKAINDIKNRQETSNVTRTNSVELQRDCKEPSLRSNKRRYTQSNKIFRKLVNDIMNENESKVDSKHKDSQVKADTNNDHQQIRSTNWRENSQLHQGIESRHEIYDPIEFSQKETTTDNLNGQISRDQTSFSNDDIVPLEIVANERLSTETDQTNDVVETTADDEDKAVIPPTNDDGIQDEATKSNDLNSDKNEIDIDTNSKKPEEDTEKSVVTRKQHKGKPVRNPNKGRKKKKNIK